MTLRSLLPLLLISACAAATDRVHSLERYVDDGGSGIVIPEGCDEGCGVLLAAEGTCVTPRSSTRLPTLATLSNPDGYLFHFGARSDVMLKLMSDPGRPFITAQVLIEHGLVEWCH